VEVRGKMRVTAAKSAAHRHAEDRHEGPGPILVGIPLCGRGGGRGEGWRSGGLSHNRVFRQPGDKAFIPPIVLKLLPDTFLHDAGRIARREARVLASFFLRTASDASGCPWNVTRNGV
jgi:hypothetical protein